MVVAWAAVLVYLSFVVGTLQPLSLGLSLLAGLSGIAFGLRQRNRVWLLGGMYFIAIGANVAGWWWTEATGSGWRLATDGTLVVAVLLGAAALWVGSRPLVSSPLLRRGARVAMTGLLLLLSGAILLDAVAHSALDNTLADVGAGGIAAVGLVLLGASVVSVTRDLMKMKRRAEATLVVGITMYVTLHIPAMVAGSSVGIALALTVVSVAMLVAITQPGAEEIGTSIEGSDTLLRVRLWPIVLSSLTMGAAHTAVRVDLVDASLSWPSFVAVAGGLAAMMFAARELGGPDKPLVLPFGGRDRALQRLPATLLREDVHLVGQPVLRTTDSTMIGIEARPAWSGRKPPDVSIEQTAADAGLAPLLESITLRQAQAHLPGVLSALDGDEPWLSVPLHHNTAAAGKLAEYGEIDGLVLRVPNTSVAEAVDSLRDLGVLVQTPSDVAKEVDPEIVGTDSGDGRFREISLRIARSSEMGSATDIARVNLVVDDSSPPKELTLILSRADADRHAQ